MNKRSVFILAAILAGVTLAAAAGAFFILKGRNAPKAPSAQTSQVDLPSIETTSSGVAFGSSVTYEAPTTTINPDIAKAFDIAAIKNLEDMEQAYGVSFSADDLAYLTDRKFVMKPITDTNIRPSSDGDRMREFLALYENVNGPFDPRDRKPENAVFYSSDVFFNAYNNLYTELLKEMENEEFYPAMKAFSKTFFEAASQKAATSDNPTERTKWTKIRDYFAVPYAILSTVAEPLSEQDYYGQNGEMIDPARVQSTFAEKDATVDTSETVSAFIKDIRLDGKSEQAVLNDLAQIYNPEGTYTPNVFAEEYARYAEAIHKQFEVDVTQFTPRGTYASSSLRRQYFRGMKWYIMVPFFLKSPELTSYAFGIAQLMAEQPEALAGYDKLESAIGFLVGSSDDLMPVDYLSALQSAKGSADPSEAAMNYLVNARNPKIKDLAATYPEIGTEDSDAVRLETKGMRLFSGKFIIDSYWTGMLTQGDEMPRPGYDQKLPPMASSLEVMGLLGSEYAKSQIPQLNFYNEGNAKAIAQMMRQLEEEETKMTETDWSANVYFAWMRTIKSLFSWQSINRNLLPQFMQSPAWEIKTLMTASGFWTELRHATILYAKQSFAELGGGGGACDDREIPPPPKSYIEPQLETYVRLSYLARRTNAGLKEMEFRLDNLHNLEQFIELMDIVQSYVRKELENQTLVERTASSEEGTRDDGKPCIVHRIEGTSDWETLRLKIPNMLWASLPTPTEGPILFAKDKRAALIADVHTGGDSNYPTSILYEAEGVPFIIFVAVNDANGPRLTVGFTYSHYEFTKVHGGPRLTDEEWQKRFYRGDDESRAYDYTDTSTWPALNAWYQPLFSAK